MAPNKESMDALRLGLKLPFRIIEVSLWKSTLDFISLSRAHAIRKSMILNATTELVVRIPIFIVA